MMSIDTVGSAKPALELGHVRWSRAAGLDPAHLLAAVSTVLMLGLLLVRLPDPVSGSDGGNWLALSGSFMGIHANAASTVYPPAFVILLTLIRAFAPAVEALRIAGCLSAILPGVGCYVLLRSLGLRLMAVAGMLFPLMGYSMEMLAWGAYPQLMGTGVAALACAVLIRAYRTSSYRHFGTAGALTGLAILTHQLAGLQAVLVVAVGSAVVLLVQPRLWRLRVQQWSVVFALFSIVALPGVPLYVELVTRTGLSSFNANAFDLRELIAFLTYDAPLVWGVVALCVPLALLVRGTARAWLDVALLVGLLVASAGLTLLTVEVRALHLGLLLGFVASVLLFADLLRMSMGDRRWRAALAFTACALWATLTGAGVQRFDHTTIYYSVLDPYILDGLGWLEQHAQPGDLAVTMRSRQKWPLGWWVQGLGHVPSYLDFDERWLYFREEKIQAEIARSILAMTDPQAAASEAQRFGVTLLVFDVRDNGQADVWLRSGRVSGPIGLIYSNPSLAIFRVAKPVPS